MLIVNINVPPELTNLNPWNRVLLEMLLVVHLFNNRSALYGSRIFNTAYIHGCGTAVNHVTYLMMFFIFARFQFLTAALLKIKVFWMLRHINW